MFVEDGECVLVGVVVWDFVGGQLFVVDVVVEGGVGVFGGVQVVWLEGVVGGQFVVVQFIGCGFGGGWGGGGGIFGWGFSFVVVNQCG